MILTMRHSINENALERNFKNGRSQQGKKPKGITLKVEVEKHNIRNKNHAVRANCKDENESKMSQ